MKKIIFLLLIVTLVVTLFGCNDKKTEQSSNWQKQDMLEFKSLFNEFIKNNNITSSTDIDAFRDITPQNIFEETGCQIFKNGKTCESYLLYEGNLYTLGIGFGGLGIVDIVTADFDGNGEKELLYTYSWGSGLHRSCFGCFDLSAKHEAEVNISSIQSLGFIQEELVLTKVSDAQFEVFTATASIEGGDFSKLTYKKDRLFGKIKAVDSKPVFSIE